jgi:hypothetical protein
VGGGMFLNGYFLKGKALENLEVAR